MRTCVRMQLGLDSADRLAAALHEAQEPMALADAARLLVRSPRVPVDRAPDRRRGRARRRAAGLARAPARSRWPRGRRCACRSAMRCTASSTSRRRGCGRRRPHRRDRRGPRRGLRAGRPVRAARRPRRAAAGGDHAHDRHPARGRGRPGPDRAGAATRSWRSPATPCSSRTTPASTSASSTPSCAGCAAGGSPAPCIDTVALAPRAGAGPRRLVAARPGRAVRHHVRRATARCPTRWRRRRSCWR